MTMFISQINIFTDVDTHIYIPGQTCAVGGWTADREIKTNNPAANHRKSAIGTGSSMKRRTDKANKIIYTT